MTRLEQIVISIKTARRITSGMLEDFPTDRWLHQPIPGAQHALWIVGHLATADDWGLIALGVENRRLQDLEPHFRGGKPITGDPSDYPTVETVRREFHAAHTRLLERLAEIRDADLDRKTSGPFANFAPDLATSLHSHVWHEGFHAGQLAMIRRSLALPIRWG